MLVFFCYWSKYCYIDVFVYFTSYLIYVTSCYCCLISFSITCYCYWILSLILSFNFRLVSRNSTFKFSTSCIRYLISMLSAFSIIMCYYYGILYSLYCNSLIVSYFVLRFFFGLSGYICYYAGYYTGYYTGSFCYICYYYYVSSSESSFGSFFTSFFVSSLIIYIIYLNYIWIN